MAQLLQQIQYLHEHPTRLDWLLHQRGSHRQLRPMALLSEHGHLSALAFTLAWHAARRWHPSSALASIGAGIGALASICTGIGTGFNRHCHRHCHRHSLASALASAWHRHNWHRHWHRHWCGLAPRQTPRLARRLSARAAWHRVRWHCVRLLGTLAELPVHSCQLRMTQHSSLDGTENPYALTIAAGS